jgi:hypothetical protein
MALMPPVPPKFRRDAMLELLTIRNWKIVKVEEILIGIVTNYAKF